ncbi:MAG TPA: monovalent cation/H(+) antiporter subunit G [Myxococcales bacterium LLY-WYZ-16_1]|nr:monovalent cation/H(+) antiporter subunit G [Myxococcales bacterium LLY-WYZ-16_1]
MTLDSIVLILVAAGTLFVVTAALGVLRFPDVWSRMHASTKAGTVGISLIMLGVAVQFGTLEMGLRALLIVLFTMVTSPTAAHLMGRSAYYGGAPKSDRTRFDHLQEDYPDPEVLFRAEVVPEGSNSREEGAVR